MTFDNGDTQSVYSFDATFVKPVNFNLPTGLEVTDAMDGGDMVEFGWNGLLTDWRGYSILPEGKEYTAEQVAYIWQRNCKEDHYVEKTATETIKVQVPIYETIEVPTGVVKYAAKATAYRISFEADKFSISALRNIVPLATEVYAALQEGDIKAALEAVEGNNLGVVLQHKEFKTGYYLTKSEADAALKALVDAANVEVVNSLQDHWKYILDIPGIPYALAYYHYDAPEYLEDQQMTKVDQIVGYKEETHVVTTTVLVPVACTEKPAFAPLSAGLVSGCWVSIEVKEPAKEFVIPGAYWDFYGPIALKLDMDKVTTNLDYNGNELPSDVTLTPAGTTVKYENVGSPVRYAYEIYIPATVTYGFGELSDVLVIKVNPIN